MDSRIITFRYFVSMLLIPSLSSIPKYLYFSPISIFPKNITSQIPF